MALRSASEIYKEMRGYELPEGAAVLAVIEQAQREALEAAADELDSIRMPTCARIIRALIRNESDV